MDFEGVSLLKMGIYIKKEPPYFLVSGLKWELPVKHVEITALYCAVDDFYQQLDCEFHSRALAEGKPERKPRCPALSPSEIMAILIWFHIHRGHDFSHFYREHVLVNMRGDFPKAVSYSRFVELMPRVLLPLIAFQLAISAGSCTGISFIDSTTLAVCRNQRIHSHKVFRGVARRGKTSMGWFYGFKLHLAVSDQGQIVGWLLTPGNVADNNLDAVAKVCKDIFGKLFGDRGYISQKLSDRLSENNVRLVTKVKKNMKNKLMPMVDKLLLRKRAIIETINDQLKNIYQVEHSRHRSVINFIVNLAAALCAYSLQPMKPSIKYSKLWIPA